MSGRFSQELHHHGGGNTICPADFELLSWKLRQNDVACSDVVQLKSFFLFQTRQKASSRLLGSIIAFDVSYFFVSSFFMGHFFFAVEELSSVHGSKCMWTLVPRCCRCIMGPNSFEIAFLVFIICIRFDKWSGMFYKKKSKRAHERVDFYHKGFQMRIYKGFVPNAYLLPPPTMATLAHSHSHSSRWDSNSAATAAAAGCKQPPPPPASSY